MKTLQPRLQRIYGADNIPIQLSGRYELGHPIKPTTTPYSMQSCLFDWDLADEVPPVEKEDQNQTQAVTITNSQPQPPRPPRVSNIHGLLNPVVAGTQVGSAGVTQASTAQAMTAQVDVQQPVVSQVSVSESMGGMGSADVPEQQISPRQGTVPAGQRTGQDANPGSQTSAEAVQEPQATELPEEGSRAGQVDIPGVNGRREDSPLQPASPVRDGIVGQPRTRQDGDTRSSSSENPTATIQEVPPSHNGTTDRPNANARRVGTSRSRGRRRRAKTPQTPATGEQPQTPPFQDSRPDSQAPLNTVTEHQQPTTTSPRSESTQPTPTSQTQTETPKSTKKKHVRFDLGLLPSPQKSKKSTSADGRGLALLVGAAAQVEEDDACAEEAVEEEEQADDVPEEPLVLLMRAPAAAPVAQVGRVWKPDFPGDSWAPKGVPGP